MILRLRRSVAFAGICLVWVTAWMPRVSVYAQMNDDPIQNDELPAVFGGDGGNSSDLFMDLLKVIFVLIVIIGLIFMVVKFLSKKNQSWFGRRSVRVLSGVQLAQGKSLQIVEIGDTVYILGVGEDVRMIDKVTDPDMAALIRDQLTLQPSDSWSGTWQRLRKWTDRTKEPTESSVSHATFQEVFKERMSRVTEQNRRIEDLLSEQDQDEKERSKHDKK